MADDVITLFDFTNKFANEYIITNFIGGNDEEARKSEKANLAMPYSRSHPGIVSGDKEDWVEVLKPGIKVNWRIRN